MDAIYVLTGMSVFGLGVLVWILIDRRKQSVHGRG